ncbi:MAG: proline dehydrogenase family protein, partial [Bacteroidales bacterium]
VFNTLQMYRWDRLDFLKAELKKATEGNYLLGMKFVRGAYMERERLRAKKYGYADPIHNTKEDTDKDYNAGLKFAIENIEKIAIFNGTHNEKSSKYLVELMEQNNIPKDDGRIYFSQLYGMSDHISFNLADEGYNVAKYLPYGPVRNVLPYLIRRVEENSSVQGQTSRELELIKKELNRRKT